jgi:hypothetical protein
MDRVGAPDRPDPRFGQTDVPDLSLGHEFGKGADRVLNRSVGVDPMLVVEVNVVGRESLQRALDRGTNVCGTAVKMTWTTSGV